MQQMKQGCVAAHMTGLMDQKVSKQKKIEHCTRSASVFFLFTARFLLVSLFLRQYAPLVAFK